MCSLSPKPKRPFLSPCTFYVHKHFSICSLPPKPKRNFPVAVRRVCLNTGICFLSSKLKRLFLVPNTHRICVNTTGIFICARIDTSIPGTRYKCACPTSVKIRLGKSLLFDAHFVCTRPSAFFFVLLLYVPMCTHAAHTVSICCFRPYVLGGRRVSRVCFGGSVAMKTGTARRGDDRRR